MVSTSSQTQEAADTVVLELVGHDTYLRLESCAKALSPSYRQRSSHPVDEQHQWPTQPRRSREHLFLEPKHRNRRKDHLVTCLGVYHATVSRGEPGGRIRVRRRTMRHRFRSPCRVAASQHSDRKLCKIVQRQGEPNCSCATCLKPAFVVLGEGFVYLESEQIAGTILESDEAAYSAHGFEDDSCWDLHTQGREHCGDDGRIDTRCPAKSRAAGNVYRPKALGLL